uniref:Ig-like domain-containing protein n=1 Tax=Varanus komodoensis TaxID=61221 RepID=A0A8D2LIR8_VARKO
MHGTEFNTIGGSTFLKRIWEDLQVGPGHATETLQLTCALSGFPLTLYDIIWVCQAPGLEWIGTVDCDGDLCYNSCLNNRLTLSRDTCKGQVVLEVRDLRPEDTGMYYCGRDTVRECFSKDGWKIFTELFRIVIRK